MELSDTFIAKPYYQHSQITHGRNVHGDPTIIQTTTTYHTTVNSPTSISSVHSDPLNKLTTSPTGPGPYHRYDTFPNFYYTRQESREEGEIKNVNNCTNIQQSKNL
eukprot:UN23934